MQLASELFIIIINSWGKLSLITILFFGSLFLYEWIFILKVTRQIEKDFSYPFECYYYPECFAVRKRVWRDYFTLPRRERNPKESAFPSLLGRGETLHPQCMRQP
jgi:hypothetical protein